jgi:hypothetical protein
LKASDTFLQFYLVKELGFRRKEEGRRKKEELGVKS